MGEDRRETPADPLCRGSLPGLMFAGGRGTCAREMTLEAGAVGGMAFEAGAFARDMTRETGAIAGEGASGWTGVLASDGLYRAVAEARAGVRLKE